MFDDGMINAGYYGQRFNLIRQGEAQVAVLCRRCLTVAARVLSAEVKEQVAAALKEQRAAQRGVHGLPDPSPDPPASNAPLHKARISASLLLPPPLLLLP